MTRKPHRLIGLAVLFVAQSGCDNFVFSIATCGPMGAVSIQDCDISVDAEVTPRIETQGATAPSLVWLRLKDTLTDGYRQVLGTDRFTLYLKPAGQTEETEIMQEGMVQLVDTADKLSKVAYVAFKVSPEVLKSLPTGPLELRVSVPSTRGSSQVNLLSQMRGYVAPSFVTPETLPTSRTDALVSVGPVFLKRKKLETTEDSVFAVEISGSPTTYLGLTRYQPTDKKWVSVIPPGANLLAGVTRSAALSYREKKLQFWDFPPILNPPPSPGKPVEVDVTEGESLPRWLAANPNGSGVALSTTGAADSLRLYSVNLLDATASVEEQHTCPLPSVPRAVAVQEVPKLTREDSPLSRALVFSDVPASNRIDICGPVEKAPKLGASRSTAECIKAHITKEALGAPFAKYAVTFGDLDRDGLPDLVFVVPGSGSDSNKSMLYYLPYAELGPYPDPLERVGSTPDCAFWPAQKIVLDIAKVDSVAVGDFGGDSIPDIAVTVDGGKSVTIFNGK